MTETASILSNQNQIHENEANCTHWDLEIVRLETSIVDAELILDIVLFVEHETGLTFSKFHIMFEKNDAHMVTALSGFLITLPGYGAHTRSKKDFLTEQSLF